MAFGEHGGEFFGVGFHLGVEFVGGDIYVVYLDVEILAGAQAVAFFLDFAVGHDYAEVFDGFGLAEGSHDFLDFVVFEADFLEAVRVLVFLAEFACVNEGDFVVVGLFAGLVEEEHAHVGAGVREYVARHAHHAIDDMFVNNAFEDFVLDAGFRGDEPGGDYDGALAACLDAVHHGLDKAGVDGHALLFLVRDFRHACPEAGIPFLLDVIAGVAEVHLEGRIAHHVIELLEALAVVALVVGFQEGVALHGVVEARYKSVQQQVQFEHLVTALRDVLRKDGAAVCANLVAERHEQGTGACAGVVAFYVVQIGAIAHQEAGHDFRDGLGRVIFGVLAAAESEESPRNMSKIFFSASFITTFITTFSDFITTLLVIDRLKSSISLRKLVACSLNRKSQIIPTSSFSRDFCNAIIYSALLTARIFEGTRPNSICKKFMTKRDILP